MTADLAKKRKLASPEDERPHKRQSLEPCGGSGVSSEKTGLVKVERSGGDRVRMIVRMKIGRERLSTLIRREL